MMEAVTSRLRKRRAFSGKNDDIIVNGMLLPPQVLTEILIRIESKITLARNCPLVCYRWYEILSAPGFWIAYMQYHSYNLPPMSLRSEPSLNLKKACVKVSFGRNLIVNPSGERGFKNWTICLNGGDGFLIEKPPLSCSPCLEEDIRCAFVTSYGWGRKFQIVDLWKEGIEPDFLDKYRPPITVSEYYNCRMDCASVYRLCVELIPNHEPFDTIKQQIKNQGFTGLESPDVTNEIKISRNRSMEQWTAAEWQRIEHTFTDYPEGIRYVLFEHAGKDSQFWAGRYGSKMAKASVIVNYGTGIKRTRMP